MIDLTKTYLSPNETNPIKQDSAVRQILEVLQGNGYSRAGINVVQTTANSTILSTGNGNAYNQIFISATDNVNTATSLNIELHLNGTSWVSTSSLTEKEAIQTEALILGTPSSTQNGQPVGGSFTARAAASAPNCQLFGINPIAQADAQCASLIGGEFDLNNNATVGQIVGIQNIITGTAGTTHYDVAFVTGSGGSTIGWDYAYSWFANSIKSTGTIMGSIAGQTISCFRGIDLTTVTPSSQAITTPNVTTTPISIASLPTVGAGTQIMLSNASSSAASLTTLTSGNGTFTRGAYYDGTTWRFT